MHHAVFFFKHLHTDSREIERETVNYVLYELAP
jgi:hypothetical protein